MGQNLADLGSGGDFLDTTPKKGTTMKEKIGKLGLIKIKNLGSVKDTVKRIRQATEWEKIFAEDII